MGGGTFHEGLPHPHPTVSYWQSPPSDLAYIRTTRNLPAKAKYVVVGSGISGASVCKQLYAYHSLEDVVVLEARTLCSGATGRNGGHCRPGYWSRFKKDLDEYGPEEALKAEKLELDNVRHLTTFAKENGIECDLTEVETADVIRDKGLWEKALEVLEARRRVAKEAGLLEGSGLDRKRVLEGEDVARELKVVGAAGAVVFRGFTLSPYKLVCGIFRRLIPRGLNIQTTTPVLSLAKCEDEDGYDWLVQTERGAIHAKNVILATNGYTGAIYPPLGDSKFLIPTRAQACAIRPGDKIAYDPTLSRSFGLEGGGLDDYMLCRPIGARGAGDIIYGGGRGLSPTGEQWTVDDSVVNPVITEYLHTAPAGFFGENWGKPGRKLMEWTGIMGYTHDGRPLVGEAPGNKGLWISAGFNGHGMALTYESASALVHMIKTGEVPDWLPKGYRLSRFQEHH